MQITTSINRYKNILNTRNVVRCIQPRRLI